MYFGCPGCFQNPGCKNIKPVKDCINLDKIRTEDVRRKWKFFSLYENIDEYCIKLKDHVQQMLYTRLPTVAVYHRSKCKRDCDKHKKRWSDEEAGTGLPSNA